MTALPTLRQLSYLTALSESLNFTAAALAMNVTQSAFSGGIQELERLLGARLVERDRQHVRLTPLGEETAARAKVLLAMARDLAENAARQALPMSGLARLGAIPTIAPFLLPKLLRRVLSRYPKMRLVLREDQTARLLERLKAGTLDFALIALPYDVAGLKSRELFSDELLLIAAKGNRLAARQSLPMTGLDASQLLLMEEGHCLRQHTLEGCGLAERANPTGIEATSVATLIQMVEEDLGVALLPQMALQAGLLKGTGVVSRRLIKPSPGRRIALVARSSTALAAEFDALAEIATELGEPAQGLA